MNTDIVGRMVEIISELERGLGEGVVTQLENQLRCEFAGERTYIRKRGHNVTALAVEKFTGNNTIELARELHVSRRTIYRALKKRRDAGKQ